LFGDRLFAFPKLTKAGNAALWWIFSLDSFQHSFRLPPPTSKDIGIKREIENLKINSEYVPTMGFPMMPLSDRSNLAGRSL
jgi:hypothetical protein